MTIRSIVYLLCIAFLLSCQGEKSPLESLDLLSHGLPLKVMAPAGAEVAFDDMGIIKDMTIKGDFNYSVQIFASDTNTLDHSVLKMELKETIESGPYFSRIMEEDEFGFIFEKKVDEDYINYDFRRVKIRGDQKYTFQTGLSGKYSLEDIKMMYNAVQ